MKKSKSKTSAQSVSAKALLGRWILFSIRANTFMDGSNNSLTKETLEYIFNDTLENINTNYIVEELEKMLHQK